MISTAVILAGGYGTRLSEETHLKPKPMVEIGGKPILWHILKHYSFYGVNNFIICCGYKGYVIKEYFSNYLLHTSNITFDMTNGSTIVHDKFTEPWKITLVDTGENTLTGGRLLRVCDYLPEDNFCFTYGDGLSDVNISDLCSSHLASGRYATVTAVRPPGRFGLLEIDDSSTVLSFNEKIETHTQYINGGFFVLHKRVFDYIDGDQTSWELEPLTALSKQRQLHAFKHHGFWQPMDTLRDKQYLDSLWNSNSAPWHFWS